MNIKLYLIFLNQFFSCAKSSVIIDVLKNKNIYFISVFTCHVNQQITFLKSLNLHGIKLNNMKYNLTSNNSHFKSGIIVNTTCENWMHIVESLNQEYLNWIIYTKDYTLTIELISQYPFEINSDVIIILQKGNNNFELYEYYNSGFFTNGNKYVKNIGYWNPTGFKLQNANRFNMSDVVLKCMVVVTQPIIGELFEEYLERSRQTAVDSLHKLKYFTLLKYLRDMYHFRWVLDLGAISENFLLVG